MQSLQARLDSFNKSKRTKQSLAKSTSTTGFKWPHPSTYKATPRTLADAGFYFDPSSEDKDNVTCFMCGKELSDWDADDDPFEIHWEKCRNTCPWAIARCGLVMDLDDRGNYKFTDPTRLPTSKTMEKARLDTFSAKQLWPHDAVKGHGANSKKMAKAGFVYTPQSPGDDTATCLYCDLSLSGWDDDDDPIEEHLKREKKSGISCIFFSATSSKGSRAPPSKGVSKASTPVESDDDLATAPPLQDSNARSSRTKSVGSRASTAVAKTPGSRRSTRGTGKTPASRTTAGSEVEDTEGGGSESDAGKRVSKSKRKGQNQAKERIQAIEEEEEEEREEQDEGGQEDAEVLKEKPKRGRPAKTKKPPAVPKESPPEDTDVEPIVPTKKTHTRTRSRANLESESDAPMPSSSKPPQSKTKPSSKAKGKAVQIQEDSIDTRPPTTSTKDSKKKKKALEDSEPPSDVPLPAIAKSKVKGTKVSRSKSKKVVKTDSDDDEAPTVPNHEQHASLDTTIPKNAQRVAHSEKHILIANETGEKRRSRVSSVSDDAGYATAEPPGDVEPMDVDNDSQVVGPTQTKEVKSKPRSRAQQAASVASVSQSKSHHADNAPEVSADIGRGAGVSKPTSSTARGSSSISSGHSTPSDAGPSRMTRPIRTSRTGSSGTDGSTRSGQRTKDKMTIVEIPSDGEDDEAMDVVPTRDSHGRPSTQDMTLEKELTKTAAPQATSRKGQKFQVEVVIPISKAAPPKTPVEPDNPARMDADVGHSYTSAPVHGEDQFAPMPSSPPRSPHNPPAAMIPPIVASNIHTDGSQTEGGAPSLNSFTPLMAILPIQKLTALTEEESTMTVEQYIRREIEIQYEQLKADGERRIAHLKEKAYQTRRVIEAL